MKSTRITIFDYGAGNLHSLAKALEIDETVIVTTETDPIAATKTDILVLPGVGAFSHACDRLAPGRVYMRDAIHAGLPTLGICLGMQLLFNSSDEGPGEGLGVISGHVRRIRATRIPHIGWNTVECSVSTHQTADSKTNSVWSSMSSAVFGEKDQSPMMYFANSYVCDPSDLSVATAYTTHESDRFVAAVVAGAAVGVQFHPEKSSAAGIELIRTFAKEAVR